MQPLLHGSPLYSISEGVVVRSDFSSSYGNVIIIKSSSGMGFLYAHMSEASPLKVGDTVEVGQYIGHEGTTGDSSGIHLHLEMQDISNHSWNYSAPLSAYSNPAEFMGFPNTQGISVIYYGTPIPPKLKKYNYWKYLVGKKININT